jgi:hypothetical protein
MTSDKELDMMELEEEMLTSPEMVIGIATLSEESTAATELALDVVAHHQHDHPDDFVSEEVVSSITTTTEEIQAIKAEAEVIDAPCSKRILKFAIPAIGVWLCGPILSLIDTSSVGLLSGTSQQAALNPAVAVTEYCALLIVSQTVLCSFLASMLDCLVTVSFSFSSISIFRLLCTLAQPTSLQQHRKRIVALMESQLQPKTS